MPKKSCRCGDSKLTNKLISLERNLASLMEWTLFFLELHIGLEASNSILNAYLIPFSL